MGELRYEYTIVVRRPFVRPRCSCEDNIKFVGLDVLTAVTMKSTYFWDVAPRGLVQYSRRFGAV
jgi:hypothetical protein